MSTPDIGPWLTSHGLECYVETFEREHIDLQSLPDLDDDHLKELGVSVGHRIKIRKAINEMQNGVAPTIPTSAPSTTSSNSHNAPDEHSSPTRNSPHRNVNENIETIPESDDVNPDELREYVCKVIVVGDIGTGKTSLIQRYTQGTFDKGYKATIGVDFCLKEIRWNSNTTVSVQLWDIAGQERFANLTRMYYKEARGAFVVFDVTREKTFEATLKWKADIDAKVTLPNGKVIPVVLLANKCDLSEQPLNLDEFCKQHGFLKWFLTSAKEDVGIDDASKYLVQTILENDEVMVSHSTVEYQKGINIKNANAKNTSSGGCCS